MALNINGTTGISGVDGSASAPALQGTDSNTGINFASDTVNINTGGVTRATVDSSGNLGIGTNSPSYKLEVSAETAISGDVRFLTGSRHKFIGGGSGSNLELGTYSSSNTSRDVHMSIDSAGNVGIGTSSPSAPLTVSGTIFQTNTSTSITTSILHLRNTVSSGQFRVRFDTNNSLVGSISVGTSSTAYNTSSDYRLKENITAISDGITRLKTLKPSRFNWITEPNTTVDGFLAHEVTAVPEAIEGTKDAVITQEMFDAGETEGEVGDPIYQQIDQGKLVPLLTAALQEAIAKIEVLETKVAALEAA